MCALAIALLAGIPLFMVACGSGDGGSERAVEWSVGRPIDPKSNRVRLTAVVEVCWYSVSLEEPTIEYSDNRAYIELRHTPEKGEGEHGGCFLSLAVLHKTVTLERNLGELVLYDASADPPEQRWPRQQ
jgi:hypothetical protein